MTRFGIIIVTFLLNVRYVFGYLAAGFLVAVPLQWFVGKVKIPDLLPSLLYGGVSAFIFVILMPLTRVTWTEVKLPEFRSWELSVTRNATILAGLFYGACVFWGKSNDNNAKTGHGIAFDLNRLEYVIRANWARPAPEIASAIGTALERYRDGASAPDDETAIVVRVD